MCRNWKSIEREVKGWGLEGEIQYRGELDLGEKVRFLQSLDLFVVPATYDDPKGMSLIEAMACGVPVVAARRGSYTELLGTNRWRGAGDTGRSPGPRRDAEGTRSTIVAGSWTWARGPGLASAVGTPPAR